MANVNFTIVSNEVSPRLAQLNSLSAKPEPILRAMGTTFMSITMGTFNDVGASFRPVPWAKKKDGTPSKLQKSGTMSRSFHLAVTDKAAIVSNPVIYAATHQFGRPQGNGVIPPRPFFPVLNGVLTPKASLLIVKAGERALAKQLGTE